jgi:DNA-directed RNA polymerase subunit RPC12/RpoP
MALQEYKCPNCGGAVNFESGLQKMKCPYCEAEFDMESMKALDVELSNDLPDDLSWDTQAGGEWLQGEEEALKAYTCKSCAGEIIGDDNTAAASCPFCGNPVVMMERLAGALRPDYVIPFKLNKEAAKDALTGHLKGKPFLPKSFKSRNHIDEIKGVYVPFWLFDADADAAFRYRATQMRAWSDSKYDYKETSFFSVYRAGNVSFDCIPVDGSSKIPDDMMESIEPYDFKDAVDFQTAYLAGYLADKYDVTVDESIDRANERVKRSAEDAMRSTIIGYTAVTSESGSVRIANGKARYALYPVGLLNTTWDKKKYTFAMNGQTGKLIGDLPLDKRSLWKWRGILAAACTIIAFFALELVSYFS